MGTPSWARLSRSLAVEERHQRQNDGRGVDRLPGDADRPTDAVGDVADGRLHVRPGRPGDDQRRGGAGRVEEADRGRPGGVGRKTGDDRGQFGRGPDGETEYALRRSFVGPVLHRYHRLPEVAAEHDRLDQAGKVGLGEGPLAARGDQMDAAAAGGVEPDRGKVVEAGEAGGILALEDQARAVRLELGPEVVGRQDGAVGTVALVDGEGDDVDAGPERAGRDRRVDMRRVLAGSEWLVDDLPVVDRDAEKRILGRDVDGAVEGDGQRGGARRLFRGEREAPGAPSGLAFEAEGRRGQEVAVDLAPLRRRDPRPSALASASRWAGRASGRWARPRFPARRGGRRRRLFRAVADVEWPEPRRRGRRSARRRCGRSLARGGCEPTSGVMSNGAWAIVTAGTSRTAAATKMRRARRDAVMAPASPPVRARPPRARRRSAA